MKQSAIAGLALLLGGCSQRGFAGDGHIEREPITVMGILEEIGEESLLLDLGSITSGTLAAISQEQMELTGKSGSQLVDLSDAPLFETWVFDQDGGFLEALAASPQVLEEGDGIKVVGTQDGNSLLASKVVQIFIEEPLVLDLGSFNSSHAYLMRVDGNRTRFEMGGHERIYPASMTKVMTALVALENLNDLSENIFIDPGMFSGLVEANAAMAGFGSGSWVKALDVLYGIMLPSGGEATLAMAEHISGTVAGFVELMNDKAAQLGLTETRFTNPIGLHDPDHVTTAAEMARLTAHALENETFRELFTSSSHTTTEGLIMSSTLFANLPRQGVANGFILGGRTGFTHMAGRCLVSLAVIDGEEYLLVTGGAPNLENNRIMHLADALTIFDQL